MSRSRQVPIGLDEDTERRLRSAAAERSAGVSLVARGLIKRGLDELDIGDAETADVVDREIAEDRARRARIGSEVMKARHAKRSTT